MKAINKTEPQTKATKKKLQNSLQETETTKSETRPEAIIQQKQYHKI